MGNTCWMAKRCVDVSMKPPVPGVEASTNVNGDTHSALPVVSMTWLQRDTVLTLAAPGPLAPAAADPAGPRSPRWPRPVGRAAEALIFQRARMDKSMSDRSWRRGPIIMTRLSEDTGWTMTGGVPTWGSAWAWERCSETNCRAVRMSRTAAGR